VKARVVGLRLVAVLVLLGSFAFAAAGPARAETWLCPICQVERIERPGDSPTLECPRCKMTLTSNDLKMRIAYISIRTRPTQVVWNLVPECGIFRNEGLVALDGRAKLWVPWSAVDYYIPRQRILHLTSGEELSTPYARDDLDCPQPPTIVATIADSAGDFVKGYTLKTEPKEESLSTVFIVARSATALDSARVRFITEVEAGKHPRLPRTQPTARRVAIPTVPPSAVADSAEVVLEIRIKENGQIVKVTRLRGSGKPEIDQAALVAAYRSSLVVGGEMGAGVPCSMVITYKFKDGTATAVAVPANPPMWREWVQPPSQ